MTSAAQHFERTIRQVTELIGAALSVKQRNESKSQ